MMSSIVCVNEEEGKNHNKGGKCEFHLWNGRYRDVIKVFCVKRGIGNNTEYSSVVAFDSVQALIGSFSFYNSVEINNWMEYRVKYLIRIRL